MNDQQTTDREIHAAFQARAEGSPSPDLAERIRQTVRQTSQQRRLALVPGGLRGNSQRLLWAAVISATSLALVGSLLLAGRQNDDRTSVVPIASPSASVEPSVGPSARPSIEPSVAPSASPSPSSFIGTLEVDTFATVVGESQVPVSGVAGGPPLPLNDAEFTFGSGSPLVVVDGPVIVEGVEWYYFVYAERVIDSADGWAPIVDSDGTSWIVPTDVTCLPSPMTTAQMNASEFQLSLGLPICYGDTEVTIVGNLACEPSSDPTVTGPSWLPPGGGYCFLDAHPGIRVYGTDTTPEGRYTVRGHFDDAESAMCGWPEPASTRSPLAAVMLCRSYLIATSILDGG